MSQELIAVHHNTSLPSLFMARSEARKRMRDFFSSHIRNANTSRPYQDEPFTVISCTLV
jgi:hypothetical protein